MQPDTGRQAHDRVEEGRREPLAERIVERVLPAADEIDAIPQVREETGDLNRHVLEIGVQRNDRVTGSRVEPGRQRRGLAEVAPELDDLHPVILGEEHAKDAAGPIRAAVIDKDDLEGERDLLQRFDQLVVELRQALRFVQQQHDRRDRPDLRLLIEEAMRKPAGSGPAVPCWPALYRSLHLLLVIRVMTDTQSHVRRI